MIYIFNPGGCLLSVVFNIYFIEQYLICTKIVYENRPTPVQQSIFLEDLKSLLLAFNRLIGNSLFRGFDVTGFSIRQSRAEIRSRAIKTSRRIKWKLKSKALKLFCISTLTEFITFTCKIGFWKEKYQENNPNSEPVIPFHIPTIKPKDRSNLI